MTKPADSPARRIAERLSPMIEQHLAEARARLRPRVVLVPDPELVAAAERVAAAVGRLDAVKYTRGEIAARQALERQARALKTILKRLPKRAAKAIDANAASGRPDRMRQGSDRPKRKETKHDA